MALPHAHLVRGPANLVRADGHLVYARVGRTYGPVFSAAKNASAYGLPWITVVASMKAAEWAVGPGGDIVAFGRKDADDFYEVQTICEIYDMTDIMDWYELSNLLNVESETARRLRVDVGVYGEAVTWRCGYRTQATAIPDNNWAWLDTAPGISGVGAGIFEVGANIVLNRYLMILISFETYPEPEANYTAGVGGIECILHF